MDVHLVAHTHWDREWYHGVGRFRQRLVALVDELLDAPPGALPPFLLDGQAVVLDDYLDVRPERCADLARALRDGRLEAGPWFVLADELMPGGEGLVRNLLAGRRTLRRLGAEPPAVLYSPDSFGHPAALPAIAAGFGLPLVVLWRGYGGRRWPAGDTVRWRAPDGTTVVLHHLPPSGYELGANLPTDAAAARHRWAEMRAVLAPRARLDVVLLHNGADHHALQRGAPAAAEALARAAWPADRVHPSTLRAAAHDIVRRAAAAELPEVRGELRDSYGYTWALQGTSSTRARQKRNAARAERLLLRDAEPWVALSTLCGDGSARASLHAAWRALLECHPHDTLCGCSTDAVAQAMDARLASVREQGRGLRTAALHALAGHDEAEARERRAAWQPVLVVRNAAPCTRGGVAEVELLTFVADEPVGPGSQPPPLPGDLPAPWAVDGGRVPVQALATALGHDRVESPRHYPDNDLVLRTRAVAWLPPVPAYGVACLPLGPAAAQASGPVPSCATGDARTLDNGLLRVEVDDDGDVTLQTADGRRFPDLLGFEDVGDAGDTYTHSPVGRVRTSVAFRGARLLAAGPLRASLELRFRMPVPAARDDAAPARAVALPIRVRLTLDAGAPFLRVHVEGVNRARDHRLRVAFRTGAAGARVLADAAFGPVEREPIVVPAEDAREERPPPTAPLHRYVSLYGAEAGVTVYADGLAEYEATGAGDVLVTLVRAVGELSRNDLPERRGHAGWPVATPGAQCRGPFAGAFAVYPHGPRADATLHDVERVADDVLLPLRATTLRSALGAPPAVHGVALDGEGLALCAIKPAEDGHGVVLRCVNLLDRPVAGAWHLAADVVEACQARLDETTSAPVVRDGRTLRFEAAPRAVVTIVVRTGGGALARPAPAPDRRG